MARVGIPEGGQRAIPLKTRRRRIKMARKARAPGLTVARAPSRGVTIRSGGELKPLPQYYFKSTPPLPPPATKLLPSGQKQIKNGKIQHRVLTSDSRKVGRAFQTGPSLF